MRHALLLAALFAAGACNETTKPPAADPMPGDYPLRMIGGNLPPQIIAEDTSGRLSIVSGMVRLGENGTYIDSTDVQFVSSAGQVSTSSDVGRGTWRVSHDTLFLLPTGANSYYMRVTVNGIELTQEFSVDATGPPMILVYRK